MSYISGNTKLQEDGQFYTKYEGVADPTQKPLSFTDKQDFMRIYNRGTDDIVVTVNSVDTTINPRKEASFSGIFTFQIKSVSGVQPYLLESWSSNVGGSSLGYKVLTPSGGYNDQVQINAAITQLNAAGGGVLFLEGNFKISASIVPLSNVKIIGAGMKRTSITAYGSGYSIFQNTSASSASPLTDIEISDMMLDGSNFTDTIYTASTKGILITYAKRLLLTNLYVYNTPATGIGVDYLQDSIIHKCIVENCGRLISAYGQFGGNGIGIGTGMLSDVENLIISECHAINTGNNGIMFETQDWEVNPQYSGYAQVINCTSRGSKFSAGFRNSGAMRIKWVGNVSLRNAYDGFQVEKGIRDTASTFFGKEDIFTNNHVYYNGRHGIYLSGANDDAIINISNNHVAYNTQHGIYGDTKKSSEVKVTNNFVYNNGYNGISFVGGGDNGIVSDNHVFNNGTAGVVGKQTGIIVGAGVAGNTVNNWRISRNRIFDNQGTKTQQLAIEIKGTLAAVTNVDIENNTVTGNATNPAIALSGTYSNVKIRNNTGYNPLGTLAITVGASPFTYTAGTSSETVYVDGGTVTSITKNGQTIATSTGRNIHLEPNESIVVTYTAAPTMVKDIH